MKIWIWFKSLFSIWEYGTCGHETHARRNKLTGVVQFIMWKAGEHGHKKDFWYNMHSYWWPKFKAK